MRFLSRLFSFGLDPADDLAARLRAHQIKTMVKITPLMMAAVIMNAIIAFYALHGKSLSPFIYVWTLAVLALSVGGFVNWLRVRRKPLVSRVSARALRVVTGRSAILGCLWGLLAAVFYPQGDFETKLFVIAVVCGMIGGGAVSLYIIPQALFAYLFVISVCSAYALFAGGSAGEIAISGLLAVYAFSLAKAGYTMASTFAQNRISALKVEEQAATIQMLLNDFSESARDWLWEMDANGKVLRGEEQFVQHFGMSVECVVARVKGGHDDGRLAAERAAALAEIAKSFGVRTPFKNVAIPLERDEETFWISLSGKPLIDEEGLFRGFRGIASDVTEVRNARARVAHLAYTDALTGLVNRSSFSAELADMCMRPGKAGWTVFYLDLDEFKPVNDRNGHAIGDKLLVEVARRMKEVSGPDDIVARLGGDEFAVLATSAGAEAEAAALGKRFIAAVSQPYDIEGLKLSIGVSVGAVIAGEGDRDPADLLNKADIALYRAKTDGKGAFRHYGAAMDESAKRRSMLERDLEQAIESGELALVFQPWITAATGRIKGVEALLRWNHPKLGQVSPAEFIPVAEKTGLICKLGDYVTRRACRLAAELPEHIHVAVNMSSRQMAEDGVVDMVKWSLDESGLAPERLELEITEDVFSSREPEILGFVEELKTLGVAIVLDDFGTGASSLSGLLKFPFDKIKIDRSFIAASDDDPAARETLEIIARLGETLNLDVTVEGIESRDQLDSLKALPCTHLQGYHFGKPVPSSELPALLIRDVESGLAAKISNVPGAVKLKTRVIQVPTPREAGARPA